MLDIPIILERMAIYGGRFSKGIANAMMFMVPEKSAAAPAPETALPAISIGDEVDAALNTEPTSNAARPQRKANLMLKC